MKAVQTLLELVTSREAMDEALKRLNRMTGNDDANHPKCHCIKFETTYGKHLHMHTAEPVFKELHALLIKTSIEFLEARQTQTNMLLQMSDELLDEKYKEIMSGK